mmetsp:Transcript_92121/g.204559  ORF Transcript_92121/g.204559 Transcript_92121/m.204559 type:complete len:321 (-) Transcript_92121:869-1831(-)
MCARPGASSIQHLGSTPVSLPPASSTRHENGACWGVMSCAPRKEPTNTNAPDGCVNFAQRSGSSTSTKILLSTRIWEPYSACDSAAPEPALAFVAAASLLAASSLTSRRGSETRACAAVGLAFVPSQSTSDTLAVFVTWCVVCFGLLAVVSRAVRSMPPSSRRMPPLSMTRRHSYVLPSHASKPTKPVMVAPSLTAKGSNSMSRVCHQCVKVSQGDVESTWLQTEPSKCASNQPATPCKMQESLERNSKCTSKFLTSSGLKVLKSKTWVCASPLSWSGWNWSDNGLSNISWRERSSMEERSTPWKSVLVQRLHAFTRRPW